MTYCPHTDGINSWRLAIRLKRQARLIWRSFEPLTEAEYVEAYIQRVGP